MSANRLLRQYYGLENSSNIDEDLDVESPKFSAKKYFDAKAKLDSTPNLLATENALLSEIRSYENELQTLVYDNYSKFLGASDVVKDLGTHIHDLKSKITGLKSSLSQVSESFGVLNNEIDPSRQKICRLVGISRLLERVEYISRLPSILKQYLKAEKYKSAVSIWKQVEGIISSQQQYKSFASIYSECETIMEDIKSQIRGQMLNTDVTVSSSIEYALLLSELGIPLGLICSQLAHHRFLVIDNTLEYEDIPQNPFEALQKLDEIVIRDATLFIEMYKSHLIPATDDKTTKVNGILVDFVNITFERIIQVFSSHHINECQTKEVGEFLKLFRLKLKFIASDSQLSLYCRKVLQSFTDYKLNDFFKTFTSVFDSKSSLNLINEIVMSFSSGIDTILNEFRDLSTVFSDCSQFLIQQLSLGFEYLFEFFRLKSQSYSLLFSLICSMFSEFEIPKIFEKLSRFEQDLPLYIQDQIQQQCKNVSMECLKHYVAHQKCVYDSSIIGSVWKISKMPVSPSQFIITFSNSIVESNNEFFKVFSIARKEIDDGSNNRISRSPFKPRNLFGNGSFPSFIGIRDEGIQIDRMFTSINRLKLQQPLTFDPLAITASILMHSVKSYLEVIRPQTFNQFEFNQIQIDMYYLYYQLKDKVIQTELFGSLIEEIINSSYERTNDPSPLDISNLSSIYEHCLGQSKI